MEFTLVATEGTYEFLSAHGIESRLIKKIYEDRPNIVDAIKNGEI
jgi:carbamoyl-phosphate synthase large subunit